MQRNCHLLFHPPHANPKIQRVLVFVALAWRYHHHYGFVASPKKYQINSTDKQLYTEAADTNSFIPTGRQRDKQRSSYLYT